MAWSKKAAVGIGVAMGICATFAAMIPSAHKSEAAIAVIDQQNIEEAARTAIQTAKILTEEQKKYALMLLQMKKLDAGILQQIAQEEIQKAQTRKALEEGTPQGVIDYHRGVDAVWLERLGDLNGILNGDITVYDEVQKEKVRKRTLDEAYKAGVKEVKQEILDQYDSAEKIAKLEENMNTAQGEAQMLQIVGAGVGEGVSAQNRTNRILAEILSQESQARAAKMYKEAVPYACRICLILTCIDISVQLGLQLVEGDKVKFMVSKFLACGIYLFLIANWVGYGNDYSGMQLMNRLQSGMRALGNVAMGTSEAPLGVNNIFGDCIAIASAYFNTIQKAGIVMEIFLGLVGIIVCVMLLLICFEMVMAYFEFWTMALLTLPLLAFGVIPQLKFLSESAIKAMFNLSIKIMCIAFLTGVVSTTINDYTKTVISAADSNWNNSSIGLVSGFAENVSNSISLLVVVGMMWILVRKMPALIQGLLQGNPSLSSGDMMGTLTGAMNGVGGAAGRVSAAMDRGSGGGGESGGGDAGGGGGSGGGGGGGGGGGSAASSPKGKMQALKNAGTTLAAAAATGGAGAVAKAGGKMLAGAAKRGAVATVKGAGNVTKGGLKAGGQYVRRNAPGMKGFYEGRAGYKQDMDTMKSPSQERREQQAAQAQQHYNNLRDQRAAMGALVEVLADSQGNGEQGVGGDARKKFEELFNEKFGLHPDQDPNLTVGFQPKSKAAQASSNAASSEDTGAKSELAQTKQELSNTKSENSMLRARATDTSGTSANGPSGKPPKDKDKK